MRTELESNEINQMAKAKIRMRIGPVNLATWWSTRTLAIRCTENKSNRVEKRVTRIDNPNERGMRRRISNHCHSGNHRNQVFTRNFGR